MSQTTQLSELARALSRNRGTGMGIDLMLPAWKASVLRLSHSAPVRENFSGGGFGENERWVTRERRLKGLSSEVKLSP